MFENLSSMGYNFQCKVISSLISDRRFLVQISDHLNADYFESSALKWLVKESISFFKEHKVPPTKDVFLIKMASVSNDALLFAEITTALQQSIDNINSHDLNIIKESTIEFCRKKAYLNAIENSRDLIKTGNFDEVNKIFQKVSTIGHDNTIGIDYISDFEARYTLEARSPISTGWSPLDIIMDGGLSFGELGLIQAPPGIGKSWALLNLSASAVKLGKTVLHFTLELNESYNGLRYDSIFTEQKLNSLSDKQDFTKKRIKDLPGKLYIKWWPTKRFSTDTFRATLDKAHLYDIKPDMVIIDYADLMRLPGNNSMKKHELLQELYEELRGIAGEYSTRVWTASQTNREGATKQVSGAEEIAEGYGKIATIDFGMAIGRRPQDKANNVAWINVFKNRFGPDGIVFPAFMDTSSGQIQIYEQESREGKMIESSSMDEVDYNKKVLREAFKTIKKDNI
jgi:replicative DNA helicase